ncbi:tRNA guanosine(34) transglycosylase Tgt [Candidatus Peregrinibacteria bacterium CG11_big_fil_rev_8_21_14_0_20_41_10]|nr:MAG: tRNA guanosine(34) transglycosylase Tgt [Candidatus Peregrinibacteria bacterium CG11_big_fil_rev_8_21_14_0_20_41_10]PIZ73927.1 MAG: tRNA guanosine(34) transglycosylase Tgt [Candidatus Peregrinibacteria bacterium CG_4_10_14_0_2_um_filter_41_8]PJC37891.1 MAG: tRNA guanosine(34) transglycosylase Tgt [Candidatus Peregrinibacteria bacterium CG_4_9_14_0_2_um_filter_41_14]
MFEFEIKTKSKNTAARTGQFVLPRGTIKTPVFMPCGTKGMVKTMLPDELKALGVEIILGNTYHLYLRPGEKLIAQEGGLPKWNNWNAPMLSDSGGFQVFSLQGTRNDSGKSLIKIDEDGVEFRSYLDGSKHYFTPEKAVEIQSKIGADIMMAFDECSAANVTKDYARAAMGRTHRWFKRCYKRHDELEMGAPTKLPQALFPIVQGGMFADLRTESATFLNGFDAPGVAIGGLSVGETKEQMLAMLDVVMPILNDDRPRYLMGVGSPDDLIEGVARGVDMFDCVLPTRLARHGAYWDQFGRQNIKLEQNRDDKRPLMEGCDCSTCQQFERSFIRHLFVEKEITGLRLLTIHNLRYLTRLMEQIREAIDRQEFDQFRQQFWLKWRD